MSDEHGYEPAHCTAATGYSTIGFDLRRCGYPTELIGYSLHGSMLLACTRCHTVYRGIKPEPEAA